MLRRLNDMPEYRAAVCQILSRGARGGAHHFDMFGPAIAEFEFTLIFADAPIDRFARGHKNALTDAQKQGALALLRRGAMRAVPRGVRRVERDVQRLPRPRDRRAADRAAGRQSVVRRGRAERRLRAGAGHRQLDDRYKFRTSPMRNVALQPTFFHNGAFTRLEDAVRHHLDVFTSAWNYDPVVAGVDSDLTAPMGPIAPVLERIHPSSPRRLT